MGADHIRPRTGLEPFQAVLAQRDAKGQPFIIVGGQAANICGKCITMLAALHDTYSGRLFEGRTTKFFG